jgi:hypothetical protein
LQTKDEYFNYHSPVLTLGTVFVVLLVLGVVLGEVVFAGVVFAGVVFGEVVFGEVVVAGVVVAGVGLEEVEGSAALASSGFSGI